jgi:uncharacterized protein YdeI (YjbR/CyaY-like superfamily)
MAAELRGAGTKVPVRRIKKKKVVVPDYFLAALRKNPKARAAFENFSPSHQREYVEWIASAKLEETRARRLQKALEMLAQGKSPGAQYRQSR